MSAVQSLRTAVDALARNPVLFLGGLVYALVVLPQRALQLAAIPLAPAALQLVTFFVTPFVLAGVVGMARDALDGEASFGTFTATGKRRYVDLLLATLVEFGIQLAFGVAFIVLALVVLVAGGGSVGPTTLVGAGLVVVLALAYLIVLFLVQFYPVVVVVDDAGAVDAVSGSVSFVRSNVVSTLGYSVVTVVLGGLAALPVSGFAAYRFLTSGPGTGPAPGDTPGPIGGGMSPGGPGAGGTPAMSDLFAGGGGLGLSTPEVVALALVSAATTALFFAFRQTYATTFYQRHGRSVEERVLDDEW
jgi:hypothetical protein